MSERVRSYPLALERPDGELYPLARLLEALAGSPATAAFVVTVEAATFPEAVAACAATARRVVSAGLPPLHFRDGAEGCPSCGHVADSEGSGEAQGQLEL